MLNFLRVLAGVLLAAIFGVAVIPLLVLMDLNEGGDGWGLCEGGIATCRTSYFDGFELLAILSVTLFALLGLLHLTVRTIRQLEAASRRPAAAQGRRPGQPRGRVGARR